MEKEIEIRLEEGARIPTYQTSGSSGADLYARLRESVALEPGQRCTIGTGVYPGIPEGLEVQIRSRSGLARKMGVVVLNSPGTIDSDYRGEIQVVLINHGEAAISIHHGDRVAQMVVAPVLRGSFRVTEALSSTERGDGGFGHTGI